MCRLILFWICNFQGVSNFKPQGTPLILKLQTLPYGLEYLLSAWARRQCLTESVLLLKLVRHLFSWNKSIYVIDEDKKICALPYILRPSETCCQAWLLYCSHSWAYPVKFDSDLVCWDLAHNHRISPLHLFLAETARLLANFLVGHLCSNRKSSFLEDCIFLNNIRDFWYPHASGWYAIFLLFLGAPHVTYGLSFYYFPLSSE